MRHGFALTCKNVGENEVRRVAALLVASDIPELRQFVKVSLQRNKGYDAQ
jgi:hypothetical protein